MWLFLESDARSICSDCLTAVDARAAAATSSTSSFNCLIVLFCKSSAPTIAQSNSDRSVGQSVIGPSPLRFICWERILAKDSFWRIRIPNCCLSCLAHAGVHGEGLCTACLKRQFHVVDGQKRSCWFALVAGSFGAPTAASLPESRTSWFRGLYSVCLFSILYI